MKLNGLSLAAVGLIGLLACSNLASAQDNNAAGRAERRGQTVQQRVDRMATGLKLNDDQKAKVTALFEQQGKQRRELSTDRNLSRDERREKIRALTQEENKQLKAILTPEQFEKWQTLREQMRARRSGGSESPAPAPAPEPKTPNKAQ